MVLTLAGTIACATAMGASAPVSQYGTGPSFCTVVTRITLKLPRPPHGGRGTSVSIYLSALESTLGLNVTVPSAVAATFLSGNTSSFLRRARLGTTKPGTLKPFVRLRRVKSLTGSPARTTILLARELAALGASRSRVLSGRPVRIDVVVTLRGGAKLLRHTLLLPCQRQTGPLSVTLAGFSPPGGASPAGSSTGGGLAAVLVLGIAGLGFGGSAGVRRLRRRRSASV